MFLGRFQTKGRLTGAEIRFLRSHIKLTYEFFGKMIGVDHSTIAKWEAKKEEVTGIEVQFKSSSAPVADLLAKASSRTC